MRDAATIVDGLRLYAHDRPDARAIVTLDRTITFGELAGLVADCAALLSARGIRPGECIGLSIADEIAHMIVALALPALGASYVVLATFDGAAARSRLAGRVAARRVLVAQDVHRLPGLESIVIDAALVKDGNGGRTSLTAAGDPGALLTYFSTSGTTGEAKLVPVLLGGMALQARRIPTVCTMPLSSIEHHGAQRMLHGVLGRGGAYAIRDRSDTPIVRQCASMRVDSVGGMPAQVRSLLGEAPQYGRLPPQTSVRAVGGRTSARFRREMLAQVCDALEVVYGAQECGQMARVIERDPANVRESVGGPESGVEFQVVDERGSPLPPGEIGEIRVRAPGMAIGYHDDAAATARHFRDGWFQPGDAASITADGELSVYGRADDVMNLNGIKIAPIEIERALERHPAVKAVVAFPLRSPVHGEVPVAVVQIVDGARTSERELQLFAREALGLRAPRRVTIVAELPSTTQGKVDLRQLAELVPPERS